MHNGKGTKKERVCDGSEGREKKRETGITSSVTHADSIPRGIETTPS